MSNTIDNYQDVIDSRDVIERIDTLRDLIDSEETEESERDEFKALTELENEAMEYSADWKYGATLIRDSYFQTYAQELADDIGAIPDGLVWPLTCIDWEQAARELQMDYTAVDFDGVTYWIR